jgi:hypothetical protein
MKFYWSGLLVVLILLILIDGLIYRIHHHSLKERNSIFSHVYKQFWFYWVPVLMISGFVGFYLLIPITTTAKLYVYFQWFMVLFVMLYLPKSFHLFWVGGLKVSDLKKEPKSIDSIKAESEKVPYPKITRKKFVSQMGIILATAPMVSMMMGVFKGRFAFYTRYQKISFPNLPVAFDGMRIVQISDSHLGSFNSNFEALEEVVEMINAEHPDIVVFTGDLVNNFYQETIGWEKVFARIKASVGKYSILGNHDYGNYSRWNSAAEKEHNFQEIVNAHHRLGFTLLRNQHVLLSRHGEQMAFAGVDYWGHSMKQLTCDLEKASSGLDDIPFKVLLSHDPNHWDAEIVGKTNYDLMLAGHTHGMQFGIDFKGFKWSPAQYKFKRWDGLYREGNQFMFVNRGLGVLGMPARVGMLPEITVIDLSRGPVGTDPM